MNQTPRNQRSNVGYLVLGLVLIGIGGLWLLGVLTGIDFGHYLWPFFLIVPGVLLLFMAVTVRSRAGPGLMIAGAVITMIGLLLLFQNVTGLWASWAYAWALVGPTAVGAGLVADGARRNRPEQVKGGRRLLFTGLILFFAFGVFFELIIGVSGLRFRGWALGLLLMAGGLALLFTALRPRPKV
jgi:hypothetical protein